MLREELIDAITFGKGVAESDSKLERYFVRTRAFSQVIRGDSSLILGAKGSGKTALSRMLASGKVPELRDVIPVTALRTESASLFSDVPSSVTEMQMRQIWMAYFTSLAGDQLRAVASDNAIESVTSTMESDGFPLTGPGAYGDRMASLVDSMVPAWPATSRTTPTLPAPPGSLGGIHRDGHQSQAGGWARWTYPAYQFKPVITQIAQELQRAGKRCWIIIDRLDEAFPPSVELVALRGLLRAHMDLVGMTEHVATKVFLRSDIFDKVTRGGFRNADHLHPVELTWRRESLLGLVAERIRSSAGGILGLQPEDSLEKVVGRCLPREFSYDAGSRYETTSTFDWCLDVTAGGKDQYSPRNLVRLLGEAQTIASGRLAPDEELRPGEPLLRGSELLDAWRTLSSRRLVDTLYAEYPELQPYVEKFYRQHYRMTTDTIRTAFLSHDSNCDPAEIVLQLERIGFLYREGPSLFTVAKLYQPALQIGTLATVRTDVGSPSLNLPVLSEERRRDAAKELASQKQMPAAVRTLLDDPDISMRNAVLAINIAIESRARELMEEVDDATARTPFASDILGRRVALKFGAGKHHEGRLLIRGLNRGDDLYRNLAQFATSLANDALLEHDIWAYLIDAAEWSSGAGSDWDELIPLFAAGRLLAVARGLRAGDFDKVVERIFSHWYGNLAKLPRFILTQYLTAAANGYGEVRPEMRPYQVVSIVRVLKLAGWQDPELEESVVAALARRVSSVDENLQRDFRSWAALDPIAAQVVDLVGRP